MPTYLAVVLTVIGLFGPFCAAAVVWFMESREMSAGWMALGRLIWLCAAAGYVIIGWFGDDYFDSSFVVYWAIGGWFGLISLGGVLIPMLVRK